MIEAKGGAIPRVPRGRDGAASAATPPFAFYGIAQWEDPAEADEHIAWARELGRGDGALLARKDIALNFVMDEGDERVQATFGPEKYARLVALKDEYDPENLFRRNQNIRPSGG